MLQQLADMRTRRLAHVGQGGFSLIESIIAITIIGLTVMALIAAILTVLYSTNSHKRSVFSGVELTTIAETVRDLSYVDCEAASAMESRLGPIAAAMLPGYQLSVADVTFANSNTNDNPNFDPRSDCLSSTDYGVQRVVLRVSSPGTPNVSEEVVVLKRDRTCPPALPVTPARKC